MPKLPKGKVEVASVDLERLFDTLYEYVRSNLDRRKTLSLRAKEEHVKKGRGIFVVHAFDPDKGSVQTDIDLLYKSFEWWNHERCTLEPLPEYLPSDRNYDPEIYRYLHSHDPNADFILAMTFRSKVARHWATTMNTLGHYHGPNTVFIQSPKATNIMNPYESIHDIGTPQTFTGTQCGAEGCDVMRAKRRVAADCEDCGATAESCQCTVRQSIDNTNGEPLKVCARCRQIAYCSRECQLRDWKRHQAVCKKKKATKVT